MEVRNWLATVSKHKNLPGGTELVDRYKRFGKDMPALCKEFKLKPKDLIFSDRCNIIRVWLRADR